MRTAKNWIVRNTRTGAEKLVEFEKKTTAERAKSQLHIRVWAGKDRLVARPSFKHLIK